MMRCRYCWRVMRRSALAYAENPFCVKCLPERTAPPPGVVIRWRPEGKYFVCVYEKALRLFGEGE